MMRKSPWLSAALGLLGVLLLAVSLGAAPACAQPAVGGTASSGAPDWSPKTDVTARYGETAGAPCTGGSGVTVCPTLKSAGDPSSLKGVIGTVKGKELKLGFCVSPLGEPEDVEIVQPSGSLKVDREMVKFIRTYRYNPGTVNGMAARLCGVVAAFKF